jgi:hypothetical protein
MGSPEEGSGGTPLDTAPRDGRKSTNSHPVPNANPKASGGSTPATEGGKFTTGYERIEAAEAAGGGDENSLADPATPRSRNYIRSGEPTPAAEDIGEVSE